MSALVTAYGLPILFALFVWWASTAAIFVLDTRPAYTFRWSFGAVTVLAAAAVWGVIATAGQPTLTGAYAGFTYGLIVWGWLETGFYMGFMIGPRRTAPAVRSAGWAHFREAAATNLYHEVAAVALAAVLAAICWDMPNRLALWTFLLLWLMQLSAKLNVFLGVPNLAEEFLPEHLYFLRHYMTRSPMNLAFPFTVSFATAVTATFVFLAVTAHGLFAAASFAMLASMAALAVLEHWLLVVPLRLDVLWRWALGRDASTAWTSGQRSRPPVIARSESDEATQAGSGDLNRFAALAMTARSSTTEPALTPVGHWSRR